MSPEYSEGENSISCGPSSLQYALDLLRITSTQVELAKLAGYTETWGTTHQGMSTAAELKGAFPIKKSGLNLEILAAVTTLGGIAIVNYMARDKQGQYNPLEDGHYAIYRHHDNKNVILRCCNRGIHKEPITEFNEYWWDVTPDRQKIQNWALILFPDQKSKENSLNTILLDKRD